MSWILKQCTKCFPCYPAAWQAVCCAALGDSLACLSYLLHMFDFSLFLFKEEHEEEQQQRRCPLLICCLNQLSQWALQMGQPCSNQLPEDGTCVFSSNGRGRSCVCGWFESDPGNKQLKRKKNLIQISVLLRNKKWHLRLHSHALS